MCKFHSFVVTSSLDFLEKVGEVHHSQLAAPGVLDQSLLPEFDVVTRRLDMHGRTLFEALIEPPTAPHLASQRRGACLQRAYENVDRFLGEEALSALDAYLWQRFGTVENLVGWVEPWWHVASAELVGLLNKRPEPLPSEISFAIPERICGAGSVLSDALDTLRWKEIPGTAAQGTFMASAFLDNMRAREAALRNPFLNRPTGADGEAEDEGGLDVLLLSFRRPEDPVPYVWGQVRSSFGPDGRGFTLRGRFVFDAAVVGPRWPGVLPDSVAELFFADMEDTRRAYRVNDARHGRVLTGEMTYGAWGDAMLQGGCVEEWKHDLDPDYALGFTPEPVYARHVGPAIRAANRSNTERKPAMQLMLW